MGSKVMIPVSTVIQRRNEKHYKQGGLDVCLQQAGVLPAE
jgi:hypothetical protein